MPTIKLAIIYYSSTGTNYQLAQWAAESAESADAEIRIRKVEELAPQKAIDSNRLWKKHAEATKDVPVATLDDLDWADAIIFSMPTRFGNLPSQMKQFLDSTGPLWAEGKLTNKIVSGMTSAINPHGGQEATLLSLYTTMYHWGTIVVTPGYTDPAFSKAGGNPYGTSVAVDPESGKMKDDVREAVNQQTKRVLEVAGWVKKGESELVEGAIK